MTFASLLAIVLTLAGCCDSTRATHRFFDEPILFGCHRGGKGWRPESTVKTFRELVTTWPEVMLECDVHMTKDGRIVVIHDDTVDRTTEGTGNVPEMTLAEVQALDAGYDWTNDNGETHPYRAKGYSIPTLEEALAVAPRNNWLVELKDQKGIDVERVVEIIEQSGMVNRVLLASFNPDLMAAAEALNPNIATCFDSTTRVGLMTAYQDEARWDAYTPVDDVFSLWYTRRDQYGIGHEDVAAIQAKGIPICAYVIDDPETIRELLDLGVRSMLTDRPDIFAEVLNDWRSDP